MELRQLRHFVVLAEELHFGRASERLFISQPALSTSISRLESEFEIRLFDRDNKTVRITLAGELMLSYARELINHADRTKSFSRSLALGKSGRIEVGFSGLALSVEVQRYIKRCRRDNPDIEIALREVTSQKQLELLRAGRLDASLVILPVPPVDLECVRLFEDQFVACIPEGHALSKCASIDVGRLRDEPFVLQSRESAPSVFDMLVGLCVTAGFYPNVAIESSHTLSTVNMVARGVGVALVLQSLSKARVKGVVFVPLEQELSRHFAYFLWNAARNAPGLDALVHAMKAFAACAQDSKR